MRAFIVAASALLVTGSALVFSGCSLLKDPREKDEEPQPESSGESLAGTWTRQGEPPRVFDVTDDGTTVHGELRANEDFKSYTFDLKRSKGKLTGKATMVRADIPSMTFESKWDAKVAGTVVTIKQEEHVLEDDADKIAKTEVVEYKYDVAAAAVAEAAPPPMPEMDMSAYVPVSPTYKHLLSDDVAVGHWVDVEMETAGMKMLTRTAVVGEAGDAWILEIDNQMNQKDLLLAVFVDKASGNVTKAFVGKRGKEGKPKDVPPPPATQAGEAPAPTEEEVTVPAGSFPAHRTDVDVQGSTYSTWVGAPGSEAEGVMLKSANPQGTDELKSLETRTHDVSGTGFDARHLVYTSGQEMVMATGETKPHLNQVMLLMKTAQMTMGLKAQGDDAKPELELPQ